jgi:hypothetical protein
MGWKSTRNISRDEAIRLIQSRLEYDVLHNMTNRELEDIVEGMGFGENPDLDYFGHNFSVFNNDDENPQD